MWFNKNSKHSDIERQIKSAHRDMPSEVYNQWLMDFLSSLSEKEVKQLKSSMPALIQVGCEVHQVVAG